MEIQAFLPFDGDLVRFDNCLSGSDSIRTQFLSEYIDHLLFYSSGLQHYRDPVDVFKAALHEQIASSISTLSRLLGDEKLHAPILGMGLV